MFLPETQSKYARDYASSLHRVFAAFLAILTLCFFDRFFARAMPPFRPISAADEGSLGLGSAIWPVASPTIEAAS